MLFRSDKEGRTITTDTYEGDVLDVAGKAITDANRTSFKNILKYITSKSGYAIFKNEGSYYEDPKHLGVFSRLGKNDQFDPGTYTYEEVPDKNKIYYYDPKHYTYTTYKPKLKEGGPIYGPGTSTSDSIPAMLSNGEYVIRANAVKTIGTDVLDRLNHADKQRYANVGIVGYDNGGYINRDNTEYWDARRRYIMHPGEYLWMLAERFLPYQPAGTTLNDFAQQIINSNSHVNSGNPSLLSIGEHVFIPGISYPGKYGEPLKPSKIKKPIFMPWGTDFNISESHVGQGGSGIGGGLFGFGPKFYASGGLVGYKDGGKPKPPKPPKIGRAHV